VAGGTSPADEGLLRSYRGEGLIRLRNRRTSD
jgi:hypothetical protein